MKTKDFSDLLELELKDLYSAEKQLTKALPKMAKAATNEELKQAFQTHLEETEGQIERLEKIFKSLSISYNRVEKCKAMEGLIEEGKEIMEEDLSPDVLDAALICAAQKVEHYEIAACTAESQAGLLETGDDPLATRSRPLARRSFMDAC